MQSAAAKELLKLVNIWWWYGQQYISFRHYTRV